MERMSMSVRIRLCVMMFVQFMMFAVWWPPLAAYLSKLGLSSTQMAWTLSSMALGCLASPIIGMIADRHFASQKVLFVLNLLSAGLLFFAANQTNPTMVFALLLVCMLCYMPTWGLTSAIAMANSPSEKFPQIRVFGSIGWFASGIFSFVAMKRFNTTIDGTNIPLLCGAATSLVAAIVALTLPNTPPPAKGQKSSIIDALGLRAVSLMADYNFALFIILSTLVMIPFTIYWSYCSVFLQDKGFQFITITMNWGQFAEMFFMLLIPLALARMGIKRAMLIGLCAMLVRYAAFLGGGMLGQTWLYFVAILVHGIIYGFFFVGGQIYVDKKAPNQIRARAQGFMFLVTFGVGLLVGNFFNGWLIARYMTESVIDGAVTKVYDWNSIWTITTVISAALLVAFAVFFRDKFEKANVAPAEIEIPAAD
jgi:nucleoside transporter